MTPPIRDLFEELLVDEPPLELSVDDIVGRGDRRTARRRRVVGLSMAAALALVVGLAVVVANVSSGGSDGGVSVTAPADDPTPPPTRPPSTTSDPTAETSPSTGEPASGDPAPGEGSPTPPASSPTTVAPPPSAGGDEQLPDPGFEATPAGWSTFGPSTVLTPLATARSGAGALQIETTATTAVVAGATNRPVLVTTVAGQRYRASCWVRSPADGDGDGGGDPARAQVQVQEYTTDWQRAGDAAPSDRVTLTDPGRWYPVTVTYTARQSGNQLPLTVFSTDLRAGGPTLLADDCSLVLAP